MTRCLKMHHNYRGSPLARPRFLARVEYEAVGFPCIRYERFYLWLPAPGPNELWYCFGRFSESTRSVTRINRGGERERKREKKMKIKSLRARGTSCISPRYVLNGEEIWAKERHIILFLHQTTRDPPIFYDRLTTSLVCRLFESFKQFSCTIRAVSHCLNIGR